MSVTKSSTFYFYNTILNITNFNRAFIPDFNLPFKLPFNLPLFSQNEEGYGGEKNSLQKRIKFPDIKTSFQDYILIFVRIFN